MNFKLGDPVRFLNEKQEGIITRIVDHQLVGVSIEGDFEILILANELVPIHSMESSLRDDFSSSIPESPKVKGVTIHQGIYWAAHPDERASSLYRFHLINQTDYELLYICAIESDHTIKGLGYGELKAHNHTTLFSLGLDELDTKRIYHFQFLFYQDGEFSVRQPLVIQKELKAKQLITSQKNIPGLAISGFLQQLDESRVDIDPERLKDKFYTNTQLQESLSKPEHEIDLHIEAIREDSQNLSSQEILNIQREVFRKNLEAAIAHNYQSIIFIHGVGNGTLRNEIHKQLGKHPQVRTFKDARKEKFGYGATEVILK